MAASTSSLSISLSNPEAVSESRQGIRPVISIGTELKISAYNDDVAIYTSDPMSAIEQVFNEAMRSGLSRAQADKN
ncbi:hypothetical protein NDU88_006427 [Pleurodeles waltl]|uniref:Uncharacterized protein n=1 Tax=Pleurodeles waltl TaxID=8319 RepID=A0AAV7MZ53_PLEWA|nr:hypothetical protein NDU88_006427 [Pleurodeles waltl]